MKETNLVTKLSVPLVRSIKPPVGLTSSPTSPRPVPFSRPTAPSFFRPTQLRVTRYAQSEMWSTLLSMMNTNLLLAVSLPPSLLQTDSERTESFSEELKINNH